MRGRNMELVFSLFALLIFFTRMGTAQSMKVPVNVGVVLDKGSKIGKMGLRCISMALSDFYASHRHYKTRIVLNDRDSKRSVVGAAVAGTLPISLSLSLSRTCTHAHICIIKGSKISLYGSGDSGDDGGC